MYSDYGPLWPCHLCTFLFFVNKSSSSFSSYFGKITLVNTLLLPFVYLAQNIITPKDVINTINSISFKFLWNNSRDKIKRTNVIGNKLEGGLEVLDFKLFLNTQTIKIVKSLIMTNSANWKKYQIFSLKNMEKTFSSLRLI